MLEEGRNREYNMSIFVVRVYLVFGQLLNTWIFEQLQFVLYLLVVCVALYQCSAVSTISKRGISSTGLLLLMDAFRINTQICSR